jgi:hypothetical protein
VSLHLLQHHRVLANQTPQSVVFASTAQIVYIVTLTPNEDLLYEIWRVVVCGQIVQVASIMTSTIPFLKPFLMSVESGLLSVENKAHHTITSPYSSAVKSGHHSAYVKIGSVKSRDPSAARDVVRDKEREI